MKLFLRKTVLVFLILTVLLVVVTIINWAYITNSNYFILNKNINVLVLGDSHAKYALDDKILKNTCNLSTDADSYFYSYLKLKELNKKNIQIDTLLLSFSQHNISKSIETMWLFNSEHLKNRLKF
jgi:ABC-type sugar transport system permease subunit